MDHAEGDVELGNVVLNRNAGSDNNTVSAPRRKIPTNLAVLVQYSRLPIEEEQEDTALQNVSNLPDILIAMGIHELYTPSLYRALLIEYMGTAVFVYVHVAIVLAGQLYTYPPLQIGIAHGILIMLFILQFAMSSGAHFNSLISISSMVTGHIPIIRGMLYVAIQVFGAASGAELMRRSITETTARSVALGTCNIGTLQEDQALAIEFFFCLMVLYTVYGTAFNLRQREIYGPVLTPLLIGFVLALMIFASSSLSPPPFTGAGVNPSLCLGTAWAYERIVGRENAMDHMWIYWIGPLLASIVNGLLYAVAPPYHAEDALATVKRKQDLSAVPVDKDS
mmetsp:Transcript_25052/g.41903  ORF Transcript_25052/g.41903 Transcript_25052/m.41903 type:complete len:337 (+) Transcript_25052:146-1156(+)